MADKLRIIEYADVKQFIYPEKWDEFVSALFIEKHDQELDRVKIVNTIANCVSEVFSTPVEYLRGRKGTRDESDSRIAFTYIILHIGVTEEWVANYFECSKGTVCYRKSRFADLYQTDHYFNRRVQSVIGKMNDAGFAFIKI
jgi:hypothetical protein